ncbi:MAG: 50S ribosomal protein L4 [Candidatus Pacebacteria bacterium RIFCSPHIGHO2_01_FULL_46_16]|nr:MAG: 50S ribosomal protein L4 [Candidatus Pacebacteria bacterium RIFCSPHIGHO2_01_FULL_46_16]OGJ22030.1 MAG: 50S ribosomal protein L4 [Candidatus Pacebacteria bacterium RIFCSPHIGHO2_02_FULL_46_9]
MKKIINTRLVSQAVNILRSNQRQGTSKVKTRAEVSLTKKKMYRQKGTGNARHGAKSVNIFVGGGVAHGPTGKANWDRSLSQTMKRQALKHALAMQVAVIVVVPELNTLTGKTKIAAELLKKTAPGAQHMCIVLERADEKSLRSLRNIASVTPVLAAQLNVLHVVQADKILFTAQSLALVEARIAGETVLVSTPASTQSGAKKSVTKTKTK